MKLGKELAAEKLAREEAEAEREKVSSAPLCQLNITPAFKPCSNDEQMLLTLGKISIEAETERKKVS